MTPARVIDSHIHLWDPTVLRYPWLESEEELGRPFLPADLHASGGPPEWVMVQAGAQPDDERSELDWIASLASSEPALVGMVVHAPVENGLAVRDLVERLAATPLAVGIRRLIQDEGAGFASTSQFVEGVRVVGDVGLPFDICVRAPERADVAPLVDACPDVSFVLDHLGKPAIADGEWEPWRTQLAELAQRPNLICKLSGSTTEAGRGWREDVVRPYLMHALETFGPQRCMFGSDWPVASVTTYYQRWFDLVSDAVSGCSQSEIDAVFAGTAAQIYTLPTRGTHR
jgi:L-fuconolactonase